MQKPSAPTPPDFVGAANAQGQNNIEAAIAQAMLSHVNQSTPFGSINFSSTMPGGGTPGASGGSPASIPSVTGNTLESSAASRQAQQDAVAAAASGGGPKGLASVPQFSSSVTLSPEMQKIFDQFVANQQTMGGVAGDLLSQARGTLSTPFDPANLPKDSTQQAVQDAMYARQSQYLDPQFDLAQKALDAKLANQGFQINNEGYNTAQNQFADRRQKAYSDARDSAIQEGASLGLAQRQQAVSEALAARNQPINELSALMGGSQVSMPQFAPSAAPNIAPAPVFDATTAQGNAAMQNFGINSGMFNSQLGGLLGLGGTGILAASLSDRRLKTNIVRVGTHPRGFGLYEYDLAGVRQRGVMADEVEPILPGAVVTLPGGLKAVRYKMLGELDYNNPTIVGYNG